MNKFWQFARYMLRYKPMLGVGMLGAILDAVCRAGGFGAVLAVIDQLFEKDQTLHMVAAEWLKKEDVKQVIGDQLALADHLPQSAFGGLMVIFACIMVLMVLGSCARFTHQYCAVTVSFRSVMNVRRMIFQRLVHVPWLTASESGTADKMSRVVRDSAQLAAGFNALTSRALRDLLQGCAMLLVAVFMNWQLTLIFLIGFPIIGFLLYRFGRTIRKASRRALKQMGNMLAALQEALQALTVVKVHQAEGYERRRFNRINRRVYQLEMKARVARALSSPTVESIALTGFMGVTLVAAYYTFVLGKAEPKEILFVLLPLGAAGAAFRPLANLNSDLQTAAAAAERLDEVLHLEVEPNTRRHPSRASVPALARHAHSVQFEQVSFRYPSGDRDALHGIDLTVPHGSVCAVVGGNGSGKSTLLYMLPRLINPSKGSVLIDGHNIADCSLRSVRGQMAMVTQQTVLFDGTIADNITYGSRSVSREKMIAAAKRSYAHDFISDLPDGYDAQLGEWGGRLSGGQRQRIAIARAILRDPAILILDEATSQIDSESEARIAEALKDLETGRTTFVIAHRLSTVTDADIIVVMEEGRIAATGQHTELLQHSDTYRVLCQTQLGGAID